MGERPAANPDITPDHVENRAAGVVPGTVRRWTVANGRRACSASRAGSALFRDRPRATVGSHARRSRAAGRAAPVAVRLRYLAPRACLSGETPVMGPSGGLDCKHPVLSATAAVIPACPGAGGDRRGRPRGDRPRRKAPAAGEEVPAGRAAFPGYWPRGCRAGLCITYMVRIVKLFWRALAIPVSPLRVSPTPPGLRR